MDEGRNAATRALRTDRRRNGQDDEGCEESFHHTVEYGCHISPDRVSARYAFGGYRPGT